MTRNLAVTVILVTICGCATPPSATDIYSHAHQCPPPQGIVETWETLVIPIGNQSQSELGIVDPEKPKDVTDIFVAYGITFSFQWRAEYNPKFGCLIVTNYPDEICKIRGLVFLWDRGYRIEPKVANNGAHPKPAHGGPGTGGP